MDPNVDSNCNGGIVAQTGAPGICVVRYRRIGVEAGATLTVVGPPSGLPGRSIAFVADEELRVDGIIDVSADGYVNGPGGGVIEVAGLPLTSAGKGGGGAGGETDGGDGASKAADGGGMNGGAQVDPALQSAFVGGVAAAKLHGTGAIAGGGGGGALSLVACRGEVTISGTVNAAGGGGRGGFNAVEFALLNGFGGGAGGNVILQAADISVTGHMFANGGGGGGGLTLNGPAGLPGMNGQMSATIAASGGAPVNNEGGGGDGGVGPSVPTAGGKPVDMSDGLPGGGGGSVGFFQTFMPAGRSPTLTPSAISPAFSPNGTIMTR
jgi:hypothetical protein